MEKIAETILCVMGLTMVVAVGSAFVAACYFLVRFTIREFKD